MRLHTGGFSDDEEGVQSGSATEREDMIAVARRVNVVVDPVTQILDKIDAELVSLTRSQASTSTSTTATDNTVIKRPGSRLSHESSHLENGDGLSISQLGPSYKPSMSLHSSQLGPSSEHDTGIGTSSIQDSSIHHRSLEPEVRPLEPGDTFKGSRNRHSDNHHDLLFRNSHHLSDDDKQRRENQNQSPFEAKNVDDKFKEIMQKRKGASRPVEDDAQTIRTEDFIDKFQDTLVYTSDGRDSPVPRQIFERPKKKLPASLEARPRKAGGPGYPPIYPKPTQTSSLPRPSIRSSLKITPGHASDADSVRTEDFEYKFKDMMVGRKEESDLESVSNDPIHTKVKQLLKATTKYKLPSAEMKSKPHVRISAPVATYQQEDKGNDSDDTLCSDKHPGVTSLRPKEPRTLPDTDNGEEETHRQIVRESDKIRKEMERERRAKSSSPVRDRSPTRTYLTLTQSPKTLYDKGDRPNVNGAGKPTSLSDEEKEKTAELKATQSALDVTQTALYEARKNLKNVQAEFEDVRTQLMLTEYKRENSSKELARLSDELLKKQREANTLDSETKTRREELKQFDTVGFTKDEAVQIIEENEKMKNKLRNLDAIHAERDELIQQLETTKQDLFTEQKRARTQIEELKDEIENLTSTCELAQSEKEEVARKLQKMETAYKKMEKEKNELIQEKTRQYEEERDKHKSEKAEWRKRNLDDMETLRQDLARMTNRVSSLQDELRAKEEQNLQLRDQILGLQDSTEQEKTSRNAILEEHKRTLQTLRKDTDSAMVQLRESLFLEKQKAVEAMREEVEQERREIAARSEDRYKTQIIELETIIKAKNEEISKLNKFADKLEAEFKRNTAKVEDEIKLQVQEAVSAERKALEEEKEWTVQQEKDRITREHRQTVSHLQEEMTRMQQEQRNVEARLKEQRQELEELKNSNKTIMHEKLVAVARAKELMRQEHLSELDRIKEQLKNEHKQEMDKLRDTIRIQEEELRQLREERLHFMRQQKDNSMSLDRTERTLINEINEECRKTSEVLGLNPRKVSINSSSGAPGSTKNATTSALANLRACNEELRLHVTDLQRELEVQRNSLNVADRQKDEALSTLKRQLDQEKEEEMARLKERLVRGLSTNEYRSLLYTPEKEFSSSDHRYELKSRLNERSLQQMSEQQQNDLERLEREINRLANASDHMTPANEDIDYAKRLAQLQSKVKQLQSDNSKLRRVKLNVSSSVPDLTTPEQYTHRRLTVRSPSPTLRSPSPTRDQQRLASALELRLREQDYETEALTQHQRLNRDVMSKKMAEMSKLQNTLTNQAKELIQLEKAYTQLNQYAKSPRVSVR